MLSLVVATSAFVVPTPLARPLELAPRARAVTMVDIPRITLPGAITDVLAEADLKNPNDLSTAEYNSYAAAAIGGTLILFILPLFDILTFFGDFIFSALIGGGALAYAALRKDAIGEYGNKFGGAVLTGVDKIGPLAEQATDKVKDLMK